ncbi:MAG TPA: Ku protein [Acidiferrobacteraceae bacterium]|nr:Ku protein [Acidiferrobacteraceae bacterium]
MPRSQWAGSISFGLVHIPVRLFNAVAPKDIRFHLLHDEDHGRIRQKRVCAMDGHEVDPEHLVRGYEWARGQYVTVTDAELGALDPEATHTIDIEAFIDASEIDPVYFEHHYLLAPEPHAARPYALLHQAMGAAGRVALGRLVLRTRQHLVAIRPRHDTLALATLYFADELVAPADIPGAEAPGTAPTARELAMATQLIETLKAPFDPARYHDDYRERVLHLLEEKAAGHETVPVAAPAAPGKVVDLMQALEASIARARGTESSAHPRHRAPRRSKKA